MLNPKTETSSTYIVSAFSSILAVIALANYLTTILYPLNIKSIQHLVIIITLTKKNIILKLKQWNIGGGKVRNQMHNRTRSGSLNPSYLNEGLDYIISKNKRI